jgi:hypothetical protein
MRIAVDGRPFVKQADADEHGGGVSRHGWQEFPLITLSASRMAAIPTM